MAISDSETAGADDLAARPIAEIDPTRLPALIEELRRAAERAPRQHDVFFRLGECYRRLGDFGRAIHAFERAIALNSDHFAAYRGAADAALAQAEKAATTGNAKASRDLKKFAAMYLLALGKRQHREFLDTAEATLRETVALDPKCAEAFWALGAFLESRGRSSDAEKPLRRAIALDPRMADAYVSLGNTFQTRGRFDEMAAAYRKALALKPSLDAVRESLASIPLMNMLYDEAATTADIYARHRAWGDAVAAEFRVAAANAPPFANSREPERKLRVAYLSPDFRYHAVSFFVEPLLAHHDPAAVEVFCYAELEKPDPVTSFLQNLGGVWRNTHGVADDALRAQLRADGIDIAIDLAGHFGGNRLRALAVKPAPVTATWLGYPATTGLGSIDWRITDEVADPPGQEAFHTERLMRLPEIFLCYSAYLTPIPEPAPVPLATRGAVTFGSFNNPQKISDSAVKAWARILNSVPGARLILKSIAFVEPSRRQYFLDRFAAHGASTERIELRAPQRELGAHLGSYGEIDIALDPFPYNGTTTTCEAIWMGVPMISLIGDRHAGRVGYDLLRQMGLEELAAPDIDSYVATAVALANDPARRQRWRGELRDRMRASPLCDAPRFARAFETALRAMWVEWCRS